MTRWHILIAALCGFVVGDLPDGTTGWATVKLGFSVLLFSLMVYVLVKDFPKKPEDEPITATYTGEQKVELIVDGDVDGLMRAAPWLTRMQATDMIEEARRRGREAGKIGSDD